MALDPRSPVIIGTGQTLQRAATLADARSPIELMAESVRSAAADAKLSDVPAIDSIRIVQFFSWRYSNPAFFLGEAIGLMRDVSPAAEILTRMTKEAEALLRGRVAELVT